MCMRQIRKHNKEIYIIDLELQNIIGGVFIQTLLRQMATIIKTIMFHWSLYSLRTLIRFLLIFDCLVSRLSIRYFTHMVSFTPYLDPE